MKINITKGIKKEQRNTTSTARQTKAHSALATITSLRFKVYSSDVQKGDYLGIGTQVQLLYLHEN